MAITNHERVGKALELLKDGVAPFLERELKSEYQQRWFDEVKTRLSPQQLTFAGTDKNPQWEIATAKGLGSGVTFDLIATVLGAARNFIMRVSQALVLFCFKAEST